MNNHEMETGMESFLRRMLRPAGGFLAEMEADARARHIPVAMPETAALLRWLSSAIRPARVLEIGTAIGFSTALLASGQPETGILDTIELDPDLAEEARRNLDRLALAGRVRVLTGDARDILPCLTVPYDLVFVDAAKGQYPELLPDLTRLVAAGGTLASDNVLFMGLPHATDKVPHKHRTIAVRLEAYLKALCTNKDFETAILPVGDGVALSCRRHCGDTCP